MSVNRTFLRSILQKPIESKENDSELNDKQNNDSVAEGNDENKDENDHQHTDNSGDKKLAVSPASIANESDLTTLAEELQVSVSTLFAHVYQAAHSWSVDTLEACGEHIHHLYNQHGRTLTLQAAFQRDFALVQKLVSRRIAVTQSDTNGNNLLHYLAYFAGTRVLALLTHSAPAWARDLANSLNTLGQTPLHLAVLMYNHALVSRLTHRSMRCRLETKGCIRTGETCILRATALHMSVVLGSAGLVNTLIAAGADTAATVSGYGNILHLSIHFRRLGMLVHLLSTHTGLCMRLIDSPNHARQTPIMLAAYLGMPRAVYFLAFAAARHDMDVLGSKDIKGQGVAHWAARGNSRACLKLLAFLGCRMQAHAPPNMDTLAPEEQDLMLFIQSIADVSVPQTPQLLPETAVSDGELVVRNLVFESANAFDYAQLGVISGLESRKLLNSVQRCLGSSSGALLAAMCALGCSAGDIEQLWTRWSSLPLDHPYLPQLALKKFGGKVPRLLKELISWYEGALTEWPDTHQPWDNFGSQTPTQTQTETQTQTQTEPPQYTTITDASQAQTIAYTPGMNRFQKSRAVHRESQSHRYLRLNGMLQRLCEIPGLCPGDALLQYLESLVHARTSVKHCTFGEFGRAVQSGDRGFRHLHVVVRPLRSKDGIRLSSEDARWEDVVISEALRAALSIPGVYRPHTIRCKREEQLVAHRTLAHCVDAGALWRGGFGFDDRMYVDGVVRKRGAYFVNMETLRLRTTGFHTHQLISAEAIGTIGELLRAIINAYYMAVRTVYTDSQRSASRILTAYHLGLPCVQEAHTTGEGKTAKDDPLRNNVQLRRLVASGKRSVSLFLAHRSQTHAHPFSAGRLRQLAAVQKRVPGLNMWHFDRVSYREVLEKNLFADDRVILPTVEIWGPAGVGKSVLAVDFANRYADRFDIIWWIDMASRHQHRQSWLDLAQYLQVDCSEVKSLAKLARVCLKSLTTRKSKKPFLLIYDGFDADTSSLLLPSSGKGAIIITSRKKIRKSKKPLPVKPLSSTEALMFVAQRIRKQPTQALSALNLSVRGWPLPLSQALSYLIRSTDCTLSQYVGLCEERSVRSLMSSATHYQRPYLLTWLPVYRTLRTQHPDCSDFMLTVAQLAPDQWIPWSWVSCAFPHSDTLTQHQIVEQIRRVSNRYTLLHSNSTGAYFRIMEHQAGAISVPLREEELKTQRLRALDMLANVVCRIGANYSVESDAYGEQMACFELHALHVLRALGPHGPSESAAVVFTALSKWLVQRKMSPQQSLTLLEKSCQLRIQLYSQPDAGLADNLMSLAQAYYAAKAVEKASILVEQSLRMYRALNGFRSSPDTLEALQLMVRCFRALGRADDVLSVENEAFAMKIALFGSETSWKMAESLSSLAASSAETGDFGKAVDFETQAYEMRVKLSGGEPHRVVAASLCTLAGLHLSYSVQQGDFSLTTVNDDESTDSGDSVPSGSGKGLESGQNVSESGALDVHDSAGNIDESSQNDANREQNTAHDTRTVDNTLQNGTDGSRNAPNDVGTPTVNSIGTDDRNANATGEEKANGSAEGVSHTIENAARSDKTDANAEVEDPEKSANGSRKQRGGVRRALSMYQRACDMFKSLTSEPDLELGSALYNLAVTRGQLSQHEQALELYMEAAGHIIAIRGAEDKLLLPCLKGICISHERIGNTETALKFQNKLSNVIVKHFGPESDQLIEVCCDTARLNHQLGRLAPARDNFDQAQLLMKIHNVPETPEMILEFAIVTRDLNLSERAHELFTQALSSCEEVYGEDSGIAGDCMMEFAVLCERSGDSKRAHELYRCALRIQKRVLWEAHGVHIKLADLFDGLGRCYAAFGEAKKALALHQQAYNIRVKLYANWNAESKNNTDGTDGSKQSKEDNQNPMTAQLAESVATLADAYVAIGEHKRAHKHFRRSYHLYRHLHPEKSFTHPKVARSAALLANSLYNIGDVQNAIRIVKTQGTHYARENRLKLALAQFTLEWDLLQECKDEDRVTKIARAQNLGTRGVINGRLGDHKTALPLFTQAYELYSAAFEGQAQARLCKIMDNLAACSNALGNEEACEKWRKRVTDMRKVLHGGTSAENEAEEAIESEWEEVEEGSSSSSEMVPEAAVPYDSEEDQE